MAAFNFAKRVGDAGCRIMDGSRIGRAHAEHPWRRCVRQSTSRPHSWSVLGFLVLVAALATSSWASQSVPAESDARTVLGRYERTQQQTGFWAAEAIQIDAAIPHLSKQGRMRAVRRLIPMSRPQYKIVEISGDPIVKQQVMARYLTLDQQSLQDSATSIALTSANYKFHFKQTVATPEGRAYVFRITPRKKRVGLIKGELWLASESAAPLRLSGSFVKNPSIFIKRIEITRELTVRNGTIEARRTHLLIKTRIVGIAELFIVERPYGDNLEAETATDHR